jgi:hypothetical protein
MDWVSVLRRLSAATAAAVAAVISMASAGHADVRVTGDAGAVQVDATRSNVGEVLSALESAFRLRVKASVALDRQVGGRFSGPLAQVLPRLLDGYNYVIRMQATEIEVNILGSPGNRAAALGRSRPPPTAAMSLSESARLNNQRSRKSH